MTNNWASPTPLDRQEIRRPQGLVSTYCASDHATQSIKTFILFIIWAKSNTDKYLYLAIRLIQALFWVLQIELKTQFKNFSEISSARRTTSIPLSSENEKEDVIFLQKIYLRDNNKNF